MKRAFLFFSFTIFVFCPFVFSADKPNDLTVKELENYVAKRPKDPEGHLLLAEKYLQAGNVEKALAVYQVAVVLFPRNTDFAFPLGKLYYDVGLTEKAVAELGRAIKTNPDNNSARVLLARAYQKLGFLSRAAGHYSRAAKNSKDPALWRDYAVCLLSQRKYIGAERAADKSISLSPGADGWLVKAVSKYERGETDKAIADIKTALTFNPGDKRALTRLCMWSAKAGRTDDAIETAEIILKKEPNGPMAFLCLGYAYNRKGDNEKAKHYLELAAETDAPFIKEISALYLQGKDNLF